MRRSDYIDKICLVVVGCRWSTRIVRRTETRRSGVQSPIRTYFTPIINRIITGCGFIIYVNRHIFHWKHSVCACFEAGLVFRLTNWFFPFFTLQMPIQEQTFAINKIIRTFVDTHADIRNMHRATFYHFGAFSNYNVLYMLDQKQIIYAQSFKQLHWLLWQLE